MAPSTHVVIAPGGIAESVGIFRREMKEFVLKKVGERKIDMEKIDTIVTKVCRDEMCIHKYLGG